MGDYQGSSGYLPLLRRSLDVPHQRCQLQARQSEQCHGGEDQDCKLQFEEAWGAVDWDAGDCLTRRKREFVADMHALVELEIWH